MGRHISIEGRLVRGLLAAATVGSLLGCSRNSSNQIEATETPGPRAPLGCGEDQVYPENRLVIPLSGSYLIEPPEERGYCYVQLSNHRSIFAYLEIASWGVDMQAFVPEFDAPFNTFGSVPPEKDKPLEYEFRGVWFRVSLTDEGNYLVEYRFDPTKVPPLPTEIPPSLDTLVP